jgi:hypothetical protein
MTNAAVVYPSCREKRKTTSRVWRCTLLSIALINLSGCELIKDLFNGGGNKSKLIPVSVPTSIKHCVPGTDPIITEPGYPVVWYFTDKPYTIAFQQKIDPVTHIDITPSAGAVASLPGAIVWNTANTPTDCNETTTVGGVTASGCNFPYTITPKNGVACSDPGVHVIPTGSGMLPSNQ